MVHSMPTMRFIKLHQITILAELYCFVSGRYETLDLKWNLAQGKYEDAEQVKSRTQEAGEQEASEQQVNYC